VRAAEIAKTIEARKDNAIVFGAFVVYVAFDDFPNFFGVSGLRNFRLRGIEARVQEELFGAARDDEAVMGVGRWRIVFAGADRAGFFVDQIFPMELVAKRKRVSEKIK